MANKEPQPQEILKLASAYKKMDNKGKTVLERLVGQLEKIHIAHTEVFDNPDTCGKHKKKGKGRR